jgi:hypothetical protein
LRADEGEKVLKDSEQRDAGGVLTIDRQTLGLLVDFFSCCLELTKHAEARIARLEALLEGVLLDLESLGQKASPLWGILQALMKSEGVEALTIERVHQSNPIAYSIFLQHQAKGGRWKVWINFANQPFELPNQVGSFLAYIAGGAIAKQDGLVAFRSPSELQMHLRGTNRDITVLVNKLRSALKEAEFNPALVQRNATDGVRFATRRPVTILQSPLIGFGVPDEPTSGSA